MRLGVTGQGYILRPSSGCTVLLTLPESLVWTWPTLQRPRSLLQRRRWRSRSAAACSHEYLSCLFRSVPEGTADEAVEKGPSKNELKKRAKEAEKAKKAAEKAAKQAELAAQKAAADVVCIVLIYLKYPSISCYMDRTMQSSSMAKSH